MSRPTLALLLPGLLLLSACVPALAQNGRNIGSTCPADATESTDIPEQAPERAHSTALRAKYAAWPVATPAESNKTPRANNGGSSDGEADTPRVLNSKWHSFLPGMFR